MRLTIIARADNTGLGVQSRNWVRLLKPHKVVVIDSSSFNGNQQNFQWYHGLNAYVVQGFIRNDQLRPILMDTDVLLTFEIPYNYNLFAEARSMGVKTILQNNWEFTDYLRQTLPLPDLLVNHSYWHLDEQKARWPEITEYCPTPLFIEDFVDNMAVNYARTGVKRFLHVAGRSTYEDRNGTKDLLAAVKLIPRDVPFTLVIKTQTVPVEVIDDPRVIIDTSSPADEKALYYDFDAMILPRRYAGACLPMNEALASGLPVIMTDIDPNNKILPAYWLVNSYVDKIFAARTPIKVYSAHHQELANKIKHMALMDDKFMQGWKTEARLIAKREYSHEAVYDKWSLLLRKLGV